MRTLSLHVASRVSTTVRENVRFDVSRAVAVAMKSQKFMQLLLGKNVRLTTTHRSRLSDTSQLSVPLLLRLPIGGIFRGQPRPRGAPGTWTGHVNFYRILREEDGFPVPHRQEKKVKSATPPTEQKVKFPTPPEPEKVKSENGK